MITWGQNATQCLDYFLISPHESKTSESIQARLSRQVADNISKEKWNAPRFLTADVCVPQGTQTSLRL